MRERDIDRGKVHVRTGAREHDRERGHGREHVRQRIAQRWGEQQRSGEKASERETARERKEWMVGGEPMHVYIIRPVAVYLLLIPFKHPNTHAQIHTQILEHHLKQTNPYLYAFLSTCTYDKDEHTHTRKVTISKPARTSSCLYSAEVH